MLLYPKLFIAQKKSPQIYKEFIKMINLDVVIGENKKEHNPNQPQIPDHSYRALIIGGSRAGRTNTLPRELIEL